MADDVIGFWYVYKDQQNQRYFDLFDVLEDTD